LEASSLPHILQFFNVTLGGAISQSRLRGRLRGVFHRILRRKAAASHARSLTAIWERRGDPSLLSCSYRGFAFNELSKNN
jgi:hypothetical protein